MMKIVIVGILLLALLVAGVVVLGLISPREHVAVAETVVARPPRAVAASIRDVAAYPGWRRGVAVSDLRRDGADWLWRETADGDTVDYRLAEEAPETRFRSTILTAGLPWGGYWLIELSPDGAGTRVRITEHGHVDNLVFRALARFVFGYDASPKRYLRDLAAA